MHQYKPVLGREGNPVRPCEGLWDRATHEALEKVILHRTVPWTRNSNREYLLTKTALCGQCHIRLYGAPDQTDLAAAAAQPHSVFRRPGSDARSAGGGAGSRVSHDCSARQRLPVGAPGLGIPSHPVPRRTRRGLGPSRRAVPLRPRGLGPLSVCRWVAHPPRRPRARAGRSLVDAPLRRIDAARQNLPRSPSDIQGGRGLWCERTE